MGSITEQIRQLIEHLVQKIDDSRLFDDVQQKAFIIIGSNIVARNFDSISSLALRIRLQRLYRCPAIVQSVTLCSSSNIHNIYELY